MTTIYQLKPVFQRLLRPLVDKLAVIGISANQVTLAALALSCSSGLAMVFFAQSRWPLLLLPLVLFVRMALNAIDGMLAREYDMQTPLGALLNELGDALSDIALYLPLALLADINSALLVLLVIGALLSELGGVVAVQIGASRRYDGPLGKSDRAFLFGSLGLLLGLGVPGGHWLDAVLVIALALTVITVVNRSRRALAELTP